MDNIENLLNVRYQTEILESLGWDEDLLAQLLTYLNNEFENFNLKHPAYLLKEVEIAFGEDTANVLKRIFDEQLKVILAYNQGEINEH